MPWKRDPTVSDQRSADAGRDRAGGATPSIAVAGLGVMGSALARNIARTGRRVVVQNRTDATTDRFLDEHADEGDIVAANDLADLAGALEPPRVVVVMVKAGDPVDAVIDELVPHLASGDVIVDAGNAHHRDTARRADAAAAHGIGYLGVGVSGGESGALHGPSMMSGGDRWAYELVEPLFDEIAARGPDGRPCSAYFGSGGAGHFVKMVHNGIEYADMGAIAEVVALLRRAGRSPAHVADLIEEWNDGLLGSYLLDITVTILRRHDDLTDGGGLLLDVIDDAASQKGTGRWTAIEALDLGEPATTIAEASAHRSLSSLGDRRSAVRHAAPDGSRSAAPPVVLVPDADLEAHAADALLAGRLVALAQGFDLLHAAAEEWDWNYRLEDIAAVWRAGCIIRSQLLDDVATALAQYGAPLLVAPSIAEMVAGADRGWRRSVMSAVERRLPVPILSSALAWYDALLAERLPTALVQAQRDVFGAHTYRRIDLDGDFHTDW